MKVAFDTNIYISYLRAKSFEDLLLDNGTLKYMPPTVLTELWAGANSKQAERIITQLQSPYDQHGRIIESTPGISIALGQYLCDLPSTKKGLLKKSSFVNDVRIALEASSIGATLYTTNKKDFQYIKTKLKKLSLQIVSP